MVALGILALVFLTACFAPPVVHSVNVRETNLAAYPPHSEPVNLELGSKENLRGVFIPADPGSPVVLHFLESGGSATRGNHGLYGYQQFHALRHLGFASLVMDYRGVGASDGERSSKELVDDARVMYAEAVRRAMGEDRVVLRSTSLGTLAAASLIESGAKPRAWVVFSPVRAETVIENVACRRYGKFVSLLARLVFASPCDVDLLHAIDSAACPILLFLGERDDYLSQGERAKIGGEVESKEGSVFVSRPGLDHVDVSFEGYFVTEPEERLLARLFPERIDTAHRMASARMDAGVEHGDLAADHALQSVVTRAILEPPRLALDLAEASRGSEDDTKFIAAWIEFLEAQSFPRVERFATLPVEVRRCLFDLSDPGGASLDGRELLALARFADFDSEWTDGRRYAEHCAWRVRESRLLTRAFLPRPHGEIPGIRGARFTERELDVWDGVLPKDSPARLTAADSAYRSRAIRRLLYKAALIPDRVISLEQGGYGIEIFVDGRWQPTWRRRG